MENGFANHEAQAPQSQAPPTYEEAFPPLGSPTLPGSDPMFPPANASYGGGASGGRGTQSAWPVKSIPSSSVTQVRPVLCPWFVLCDFMLCATVTWEWNACASMQSALYCMFYVMLHVSWHVACHAALQICSLNCLPQPSFFLQP